MKHMLYLNDDNYYNEVDDVINEGLGSAAWTGAKLVGKKLGNVVGGNIATSSKTMTPKVTALTNPFENLKRKGLEKLNTSQNKYVKGLRDKLYRQDLDVTDAAKKAGVKSMHFDLKNPFVGQVITKKTTKPKFTIGSNGKKVKTKENDLEITHRVVKTPNYKLEPGEELDGRKLTPLTKIAGAASVPLATDTVGLTDTGVKDTVVNTGKAIGNSAKLTLKAIGAAPAAISGVASTASGAIDKAMDNSASTLDKIKSKVKETREKVVNAPTSTKVAVGAGVAGAGVAAGVLANQLIKKTNEKISWKLDGCDKLEGDKQEKCKAYVLNLKIESLKDDLSRCERSSDPDGCKKIINNKIMSVKNKK